MTLTGNQPTKPLSLIAEEVREWCGAALRQGDEGAEVGAVASYVFDQAKEEAENAVQSDSPLPHCRAGCSYCCHMRTLVTAPEVLALAFYIRDHFSPDRLDRLTERLEANRQRGGGLSDEQHGKAQIPCALLDNSGCCSAYEMRPLECRGYVSFDVEACKRASSDYGGWDVPIDLTRFSIFKNVQAGLLMALVGADHGHEVYELNAALHIALTVPDATERWLAGANVLEEAALPPDDQARLALQPWSPDLF